MKFTAERNMKFTIFKFWKRKGKGCCDAGGDSLEVKLVDHKQRTRAGWKSITSWRRESFDWDSHLVALFISKNQEELIQDMLQIQNKFINKRFFASVSASLLNVKAQPKEKPKRTQILHEKYGVNYTKLDIKDKELDQLMTTLHSRKKQIKDELIVVEGRQLVCEAVQAYMKLNHLLFANIKNAEPVLDILGKSAESVNLLRVPREDLSVYSVLTTCPGLIGIFNRPLVKPKRKAFPISIVCDNIREPNNIGSVIRLANALPAMEVLLPKGNADQWDAKAIRGSSGSVFHIPTVNSNWTQMDGEVPNDALVLVADYTANKYPQSKSLSYEDLPEQMLSESKHIVVIVGGETHGISDEAMEFATKRDWRVVSIDIDPSANSLNSSNALAVILFEIRRKLRLTY